MKYTPKGYRFASVQAGLKYKNRDDIGVVLSDTEAVPAAVFTTNKFQAAPVLVGKEVVDSGTPVRAVVINAGQANACTGDQGMADCRSTVALTAEALGVSPAQILPASTGVIGAHIPVDTWEKAMVPLQESLGNKAPSDFARAIMTTDSFPKLAWAQVQTSGDDDHDPVRVMGMAKGAGMICPNMATMLGVVFTDAAVDPKEWRAMLRRVADATFNTVTVDGDTSTNDTVYGMANGASGIVAEGDLLGALEDAVTDVCRKLCTMLVQDAEGGTKVVNITVTGAKDAAQAEDAARTVGHSPLVKTAMYGKDANWGRIVAALGRCGAEFEPLDVVLTMGGVVLFHDGQPAKGDLDSMTASHLHGRDITIEISLGSGPGQYTLVASDLTHEYISINADYRS